jgi:hypothetical protein
MSGGQADGMSNLVQQDFPSQFAFEHASPIKFVIGYEDFGTGQRAMKSCKQLMDRLGDQFQYLTSFWKFDLLRVPKLKDLAAQEASEADVLILSVHGPGELQPAVKSWLSALPRKQQGCTKALVALVDDADDSSTDQNHIADYLRQAAEKAGLDFVLHQYHVEQSDAISTNTARTRAEAASAIRKEMLQEQTMLRDWGINE